MAKRVIKKSVNRKKDDSIIFAWLAAFLSIIGFIIALIAKRDDKYVMYYAKHSLVVFIIGCVAGVISAIVGWIPVIGWIISAALTIVVLIAWLFSWIYALSGKEKEIPIITEWAMKFNF